VKDYREFSTKSKIRLIVFVILWLISYLVCTISLFFWKWYIVPAISFIILFLLIYFIALDCYKVKFVYVLLALSCLMFAALINISITYPLFSSIFGLSWFIIPEFFNFAKCVL
jgi:hypothetical protein